MKGFTLIELLAVIMLVGLLSIITYGGVTSIINQSKENSYKTQVKNIISSAENWALEHVELLPEDNDTTYELSLENLKKSGNIENKAIIDSRNNKEMNGCIIITCGSNCKQYKYVYEERECTK